MNEQPEKLSSLLDEYSDNSASQSTLDEVLADVNHRNCINRYQVIGQVMRHELPEKLDTGFSFQVMSRIQEIDSSEGSIKQTSSYASKSRSFWSWDLLRPFAGIAVAASVAVVTVTLWQSNIEDNTNPTVAQNDAQVIDINQPIQGTPVTVSTRINDGMRWTVISDAPALERKLNGYLVNHTEYSKSLQGLIPQARVVGFDSQQ